jgi:hypothetical protein
MIEESQMGINKNQKKLVAVNDKETKERITQNMKQNINLEKNKINKNNQTKTLIHKKCKK